ncbi:hypothetical protein ACKWRH_40710 [Bradyrhizobium sp. Pa8]|uniref:hypothetical protein n=1 Tax=Bradyrhizobium sp. Pa8 TaxID=3386552 RepID=UPI00403F9E77
MTQGILRIWSCAAVGAALCCSFAHEARALCDPPRDVRDCARVPKEIFAQESPALPEPPFVVTYPGTASKLALTQFDLLRAPSAAPTSNGCHPLNQSACTSVSSGDLTKAWVAKKSGPFLVRFQDGRSLLASPVASR